MKNRKTGSAPAGAVAGAQNAGTAPAPVVIESGRTITITFKGA